jgi:hypothetical protein
VASFDWRREAMALIEERANERALINGASQLRTLEEMRYEAGVVAGLREAAYLLHNLMREAQDDNEG